MAINIRNKFIWEDIMGKIDVKKMLKQFYNPSAKEVSVVDLPAMNYLMIDGKGDPNNSQSFKEAVEALFTLSYNLKFAIKKQTEIDYSVMPLEGLWWGDDMSKFMDHKDNWFWTVMIMQPEPVTAQWVATAKELVAKKKPQIDLNKIRFESYTEGSCVQIMHIGTFSEEGPTVARLHDYIDKNGYQKSLKHHEIYLSDFHKVNPAKMKTVVRQPFAVT